MMTILGILFAIFVVFIIIVYLMVKDKIYHDPEDGTIYKYDTEDSEFSANQLEKKK